MRDTPIVHADLDSFYAQVESRRLGLSNSVPLGVKQWNMLLTVNYAARRLGVSTWMNAQQALATHPSLTIANVELKGNRVSLNRYREASIEIFKVLNALCHVVERTSIDEAFFDFSTEVDAMLKACPSKTEEEWKLEALRGGTVLYEDDSSKITSRWWAACVCANDMRLKLKSTLNYDISVGVGGSKVVSKLLSAHNKPDHCSILSPGSAQLRFMASKKIRKIPQLGQMLGVRVIDRVCEVLKIEFNRDLSVQELQKLKPTELVSPSISKASASRICEWAAGEDDSDEVSKKNAPNSLLSMSWVRCDSELEHARLCVGELAERVSMVYQTYGVVPNKMKCFFRLKASSELRSSKTTKLDRIDPREVGATYETLMKVASKLLTAHSKGGLSYLGFGLVDLNKFDPAQTTLKRNSESRPGTWVKEFHANSRLHYIGTWRRRYRLLLSEFFGPESVLSERASMNERVYAHVDIDAFFCAVACLLSNANDSEPFVVSWANEFSDKGEVSSVNYAARKFEIKPGMSISEARRLCPGLKSYPFEFQAYERLARDFYAVLFERTDQVEGASCDEAFVDVSDVPDVDRWCVEVKNEVFLATKLHCSIGVGPSKFLAKSASNEAKRIKRKTKAAASGIFGFSPESFRKAFQHRMVSEVSGVGRKTSRELERLGIKTCDEFLSSTSAALAEFVARNPSVDMRVRGTYDTQKWDPRPVPSRFSSRCGWGVRCSSRESVIVLLKELCENVMNEGISCSETKSAASLRLTVHVASPDAAEYSLTKGGNAMGKCDKHSSIVKRTSHKDSLSTLKDLVARATEMLDKISNSHGIDCTKIRALALEVDGLDQPPRKRMKFKTVAVDEFGTFNSTYKRRRTNKDERFERLFKVKDAIAYAFEGVACADGFAVFRSPGLELKNDVTNGSFVTCDGCESCDAQRGLALRAAVNELSRCSKECESEEERVALLRAASTSMVLEYPLKKRSLWQRILNYSHATAG